MDIDTHECSISAFFALSLVGAEGGGRGGGGVGDVGGVGVVVVNTVTYDKPELREQLQSKADAGTAPSE